MSRLRLLVAACALALVGFGCASDDEPADASSGSTTSTAASTTTTSTTTTTTTTTAPTLPTGYRETAAGAADELKEAWAAGDQARARAIAPAAAVDALFQVDPSNYGVYGCDTGEFDTSGCNWRNRATGGYINVTMTRSEQGWQVSGVLVGQD